MPFAILVLFSAFLIEAIGTFVSISGLSSLFASSPVIIVLAGALDLGKLVSTSFLYKYWSKINIIMRTYMTVATMVLMLITSAGAFGFLSGAFQHAIAGSNSDGVVLSSMTQEQVTLQAREKEIDDQIAKVPDSSVRGRTKLIATFGPERKKIAARLDEIQQQLPKLKVANIQKNTEVGPIIYVAQAFNTDPEHAVKWVILIIIFVFDPLAIALLLAGNFLLKQVEIEKEEKLKLKRNEALQEAADYSHLKKVSSVGDEPKVPIRDLTPETDQVEDVNDGNMVDVPETNEETDKAEETQATPELTASRDIDDFFSEEPVGRERALDHPAEALDHLTDLELRAHLGAVKAEDEDLRPALESEGEKREVITKEQLQPRPRSQLENITFTPDVETDQERQARLNASSMSDFYAHHP